MEKNRKFHGIVFIWESFPGKTKDQGRGVSTWENKKLRLNQVVP